MSSSQNTLDSADVARFIRDGFLRIDDAFPRDVADECRRRVAATAGIDLTDPSSWNQPVTRHVGAGHPIFFGVLNTPVLQHAYDTLVGGERWAPRRDVGLVVVRYPSPDDPGDAGWHIEASYAIGDEYGVNLASRDRALLLLVLLSDVGEHDAPTRVRVGSHLLIPAQLRASGDDGMPFHQVATNTPEIESCPVANATGHAGDVYLCHPFLVHSATWPHRGVAPRFMAQPALPQKQPFRYHRPAGEHSPVELAVRIGLGLDTLETATPAQAAQGRGDRK
jgi:hypothetical protein